MMGMMSYHRKFVPNFASIAAPLTKLTRKNAPFSWSELEESAFKELLKALESNSMIAHFNNNDPVRVKTDASRIGIAGILEQQQNNIWRIIYCCSRKLNDQEERYGVTDLEGLAVVFALTKIRSYLVGRHFELLVDHCSLCVLRNKTPSSPRLQRWAWVLSEFDFDVKYIKGMLHNDADCLSRAIGPQVDEYIESKLLICVPVDTIGWRELYTDEEAKSLLKKAESSENDMKLLGVLD